MPSPVTAEPLAPLAGVRHGFYTREGGVSTGIYASLNCGLGSRDDRALVTANRARVAGHLSGGEVDRLVTVHQVHSAVAVTIDRPFDGELPKADAIVTRTPGLVIGALAADCAPILFADPIAAVVAAAHAGWRGALSGIGEATVAEMVRAGARRNRIVAVVGPCIGQAAYEVGPEFEREFLAADPGYARFFSRPGGGRPHFDLPGFVVARLAAQGLGSVSGAHPCTYENSNRFFSFRRATHQKEPDYGRQVSAIMVADAAYPQ